MEEAINVFLKKAAKRKVCEPWLFRCPRTGTKDKPCVEPAGQTDPPPLTERGEIRIAIRWFSLERGGAQGLPDEVRLLCTVQIFNAALTIPWLLECDS